MALLHSGVDWAVIVRWLGHESLETTQMDLHARLALTQQALEKTPPVHGRPGRDQPDDARFAFLKGRSSGGVTWAIRPEMHPIVQRDSA
jgi:integrase/recombinase XerD